MTLWPQDNASGGGGDVEGGQAWDNEEDDVGNDGELELVTEAVEGLYNT